MKNAIYEFIYRITKGNADVAKYCSETIGDLDEGHVCRQISKEEKDALLSIEGLVKDLTQNHNDEAPDSLFILNGDLLYTRRNWVYEKSVKDSISNLSSAVFSNDVSLPDNEFYGSLRQDQRAAVISMCSRKFTILTGGPGTGKTHTIARAVNYLRESNNGIKLGLAAPTGKAAARMMESMEKALGAEVMKDVPSAKTLHSLLRPNPDFVTFKHNHENPLDFDWIIIDEASMIGLPMMAKLLDALPDSCRLTLVGDVDQLASVERGHILADLCNMCPEAICKLTESARFPKDGAIARLANAVNEGRSDDAVDILRMGSNEISYTDISGKPEYNPEEWDGFAELVKRGFSSGFNKSETPEEALSHLNDFRLLSPFRNGPYGVGRLNEFVKNILGRKSPVPYMITQNDTFLDVANGDVGVIMPNEPNLLYLPSGNSVRSIRLELLPACEIAFASTIHKSQGSEFTDVAIVLPPSGDNPLLTREILYTGITRTKKGVYIFAGDESIRRCCQCKVERVSGFSAQS